MPGGLGLCLLTLVAFSALLLALFRATAEAPALDGSQGLLPAAQGRDLGLLSGADAFTYCSGGEGGPETLSANTYFKVWSCSKAGGFPAGTKSQLTADFNYYSYQGFGWDEMDIYITDGTDCSKNPTTSSTFQAYLSRERVKTSRVTMGPTICSSSPCCVVAVCRNSNGRACSTSWRWEVFRPLPTSSSSTPSYLPPPSASPTSSASPTPSATPTATPTATISTGASPSTTPTATPSATVTQSGTPSVTASQSATPSVTCTPSNTPSPTPTGTQTPTPSITPSNKSTPTAATSALGQGARVGGGGGGASGDDNAELLAVVGGIVGALVGVAALLGAWAYFYRQQQGRGKLAAASAVEGSGGSGAGAGGGAAGAAAAAAAAAAGNIGPTAFNPAAAPAVLVPVSNPLHLPPAL